MKNLFAFLLLGLAVSFSACQDEEPQPYVPKIRFKLRFDPTQVRLNNYGQPATIPPGHAAQTPDFRSMCVHYIEFAPSYLTLLGLGEVLYKAPELVHNGQTAIDFDQAIVAGEDSVFLEIPISELAPGTYTYLRTSLAYQNYDIALNIRSIPSFGDLNNQSGTIASFVGFNTYIDDYTIRTQSIAINNNRAQGYWGFEPNLSPPYNQFYNQVSTGQAPAGATTVPNPLWQTSPIPQGSCVVTGALPQPLVITGNETEDITIVLSVSINNSFEWVDGDGNGKFDIYASGTQTDQVVDMGVRGLMPFVE
jgi:hypothetical protein